MTYIKKIVMQGFKSFPRKTEIPLEQGINVLLGLNGSGKSNISDAICFVLGRLSIKSIRATKTSNLIFLGTKKLPPLREAYVEIIFDNKERVFSLDKDEISIKRIIRKKGQGTYKINNETKTRQDVLNLLAQAGIDPYGFNIVLQGEIHNFVKMQPEERRKVIEDVSGISIYESRKEKSMKELEKTEEKLKEIASVLRERNAYLNNLEKERQQALKFKKFENDLKKFKKSLVYFNFSNKKKELDSLINDEVKKEKEIENIKKQIKESEKNVSELKKKIQDINSEMQKSAGFEQENLNKEIVNLRAELAGIEVNIENNDSRLGNILKQKQEIKESIKTIEKDMKNLMEESPISEKKIKEIELKKIELEKIEEKIKQYYTTKSELSSIKERISEKKFSFQNYKRESDFLIKQIEKILIEIFDRKSDKQKLEKLKNFLNEKKESFNNLLKKEMEFEKKSSINESEIDNKKDIIKKISNMDVCPVCKNKITKQHLSEIKNELFPEIDKLKEEINKSDSNLNIIYQKKEIILNDIEDITQKISKTENDLNKLNQVQEKKLEIKKINEKLNNLGSEIGVLEKKEKKFISIINENSEIEKKHETLKLEVQEITLRTRENLNSEVDFKKRELDRMKISFNQIIREEKDLLEKIESIKEIFKEKEKILIEKKKKEEILTEKFKKLISKRDDFYSKIREIESSSISNHHSLGVLEQEINNLKIEKARIKAEIKNLEIELSEFKDIDIIKTNKEKIIQKISEIQNALSKIGAVNLRSLEVYDKIKIEYESIREKSETIVKEKEGIIKIISEIDNKKKKTFTQTLKRLNELFSENFSRVSNKGEVFLELENKQDPFDGGVDIIVKTGHGKYFDVKSLSGGEQTLVALSQIFAIQEYKPYYFYVLDEIDAALDKKNSERLAGLLVKYMQKGQYIVITHNDEIMSKATTLYGISMHEGVSKIVSLKV